MRKIIVIALFCITNLGLTIAPIGEVYASIDYCPRIEGDQSDFDTKDGTIGLPGGSRAKITGGLVPCDRPCDNPETLEINESEDCTFCHFFYLFDNIIDFIMWRLVPVVATLAVAASGFFFAVSRANPSHLSTAKNLLIWTFAGWAVIFVSWMVINSFLSIAGVKKWTGLTGESGEFTGGNCSSFPTKCEEFADGNKSWANDEWKGVVVTLKHPELKPKTAVVKTNTSQWLTLGTPIDTEGKSLNTFFYTLAGWWNFSCGVTVSPISPPVVTPTPAVATPSPPPPGATEIPAPIPASQPDPQVGQWTNYNRVGPWVNKQNHATVVFTDSDGREKIWVIGGYSDHAEDAVFAFDGIKWENKPKLPTPRGDHAAVVFNDRIWVIGGRDALNRTPIGSQGIFIFNRNTNAWTNPPVGGISGSRYHHVAVVYKNKSWIIGGYKKFIGNEREVWHCDASPTCAGDSDFDFPEDGIVDHTAVVYNDGSGAKIWVMGGREGPDNEREVWTFDDTNWVKKGGLETAPTNLTGRAIPTPGITGGHSAVVFPDPDDNNREKIWVIGGRKGGLEEKRFWESGGSNVWVFDGTTWTTKPALPPAAGRVDHTAVIFKDPRDDKKKIWIIGGLNKDLAYANDLWLFTPPDRAVSPAPPVKKVFVSAAKYPANLTQVAEAGGTIFLGIAGADAKCQAAAAAQGLTGNYKAWLSDDGTSPASPSPSRTFAHHDGPYVLVDNTVVADNWLGLVDGYLKAPINKTQAGAVISNEYAWTGTDVFGKAASNSQFCENWTTDRSLSYLGPQLGAVNSNVKDTRWTEGATNIYCQTERHLYCFEQ